MSLPNSRLAFSYYPSISFNPNGTNNSVYGTTPDFNVTDFTYEDFNIRNKMIIEYGTAYAFNYENRIQWDNTLYETIAMIKECESSNSDKTF